ncbi:hypothetical protein, partial [Methylicorpusculum sp.]|uniref:hypothetical protein n=1 Tax=Methylicorpusculum sp. TaxID=2713644 RepID=UPI002AB8CF17
VFLTWFILTLPDYNGVFSSNSFPLTNGVCSAGIVELRPKDCSKLTIHGTGCPLPDGQDERLWIKLKHLGNQVGFDHLT